VAITDFEQLDTVIHGLLMECTGLPFNRVIKANQDRAEPGNDLYLTWNAIPVRAVGFPKIEREEVPATEPVDFPGWTDLEETVISQLDMIVSVNCYNSGAKNLAWKLQHCNFLESVAAYCYQNRIGWRYTGAAKGLTALQQAAYQTRYQTDIHLYIETAISGKLLAAASVKVKIYDETGNIIAEG